MFAHEPVAQPGKPQKGLGNSERRSYMTRFGYVKTQGCVLSTRKSRDFRCV